VITVGTILVNYSGAALGIREREITDSDADSMETLLQAASYSGLTLFASSGDNGSTCVNGSAIYPNRVSYPSDTPHAVSVGGTTIQVGPGNAYQSESWWDSSFDNGSFGTAGYGFSWHFGEPSYQSPFVSAAGRSVPDVAAEAGDGIFICQAFGGVSPNCLNFVGTSLASPLWAGIWALVSQEQNLAYGSPGIPAGGGYLYTIIPGSVLLFV
jgi:subtilase family serine protease